MCNMCQSGRCSRVCVFPAGFGSNFRIMVGSSSGPGIAFKALLVSARVRVPLSNKIRVQVGSVQHIYGLFGFGYKYLDPWRPLLQILQIHSSMSVVLLFSSPHSFSTGFRSEDWNCHSKAWFCAQWPIFVLLLRFLFGLLCGWKIQTWPIIKFLTVSQLLIFFICWYLI